MVFLSEKQLKSLVSYKYSSSSSNILHSLLDPWFRAVLHYVPESWSPNSITFMSVVVMTIAYSMVSYIQPSFKLEGDGVVPYSWIYSVAAILCFGYLTLDNIDGKQARKTGQSSALGQWLDHGLDTWNSLLLTLLGAHVGQMGAEPVAIVLVTGISFGFFCFQWEEAFTGCMRFVAISDMEAIMAVVLATGATGVLGGPWIWFLNVPRSISTLIGIDLLPRIESLFSCIAECMPSSSLLPIQPKDVVLTISTYLLNLQLTSFIMLGVWSSMIFAILSPLFYVTIGKGSKGSRASLLEKLTALVPALIGSLGWMWWGLACPALFINNPQTFVMAAVGTMSTVSSLMILQSLSKRPASCVPIVCWPLFFVHANRYGLMTVIATIFQNHVKTVTLSDGRRMIDELFILRLYCVYSLFSYFFLMFAVSFQVARWDKKQKQLSKSS